jgi:hypothetical protein
MDYSLSSLAFTRKHCFFSSLFIIVMTIIISIITVLLHIYILQKYLKIFCGQKRTKREIKLTLYENGGNIAGNNGNLTNFPWIKNLKEMSRMLLSFLATIFISVIFSLLFFEYNAKNMFFQYDLSLHCVVNSGLCA